jgi:tRNA A-37 threonylcarbamoyl transferase component Bud32/Flp pilus assembly protein TadD
MAEANLKPPRSKMELEDLTGRTIGRFVIRARVGHGAMGEVYRAEDTRLKRTVALKRIAPALRVDPLFRERLAHEAELASRLNDPHVAAVYDIFEEGQETFLVMEYVEGETLRERLRRRLSLAEFFEIATQCAAALATAHDHGILHGDLKPPNIVLTPKGQVKVLDFGLAKRLPGSGESSTLESEGSAFRGTPAYMAPEAVLEKGQDARSDIFSLGAVFYEMLAGKNPFLGESFVETCHRIAYEEPPPPRSANPRVPPELERIVGKMLAKEPAARYATAAELLADLRAAAEKYPAGRPLALARRRGGHRRAVVAAALAAAGAVAGTLAYRHFRAPRISKDDWILMTDFANRSGQPLFEDTVTEAFTRALEQSRSVRLVPRSQAVDAARLLGRSQVVNIGPALGRAICQRGNCRAVLAGEITSAGSTYQIGVTLEDPWQETPVFTEQAVFHSPAELYPTVDKLARNLRERLGESLAEVQKTSTPLDKVTTPSLEALQRYTRATMLYDAGNLQDALPLAKSAAELDPDFPMDHLLLMEIYDKVGNESGRKAQLALALRGLGRVTERERYLIQAIDYDARGMYDKAVERYRLLTELYPDDLLASQGLAEELGVMGRLEEAAQAEQHVLELSPDSAAGYNNLMATFDRLNRFSEALKIYSVAQSRGIRSALLHWGAGLAYLGQGDTAAAAREFDSLKQGGDYGTNLASFFHASLLMYQGRLAEATNALQTGLILGEKQGSQNSVLARRAQLASVLAIRGRHAEALAETRKFASQARAQADPWGLEAAGLLAVQLGDLPLARQLLSQLGRLRSQERNSALLEACDQALTGSIELAQGHPGRAIASEQAALVYFPLAYEAARLLARAYEHEHNWPEAVQAYQRYLDFQGQLFYLGATADWAVGQAQLARVQAEAGQTDDALRSYDRFFALWSGADPDLPIVKQARAERQRLAAFSALSGNPASGSRPGAKH